MSKAKALLIDANSLIFRAYFATAFGRTEILKTKSGTPINAVFCLNNMLKNILQKYDFDYVLASFDSGKETPRHLEYEGYKAKRQKTPEELIVQFPLTKELFKAFGITCYENKNLEADDIIAIFSKQGMRKNIHTYILSSDKDLLQLVSDNSTVLLIKQGVSNLKEVTPVTFNTIYEDLIPSQIVDLKGLMGDPSDNLPGVFGIGEKTAINLLREYYSLENIYNNLDKLTETTKNKLVTSKENAFMSKRLAKLITDFKIDIGFEDINYQKEKNELPDFYEKYGFKK